MSQIKTSKRNSRLRSLRKNRKEVEIRRKKARLKQIRIRTKKVVKRIKKARVKILCPKKPLESCLGVLNAVE